LFKRTYSVTTADPLSLGDDQLLAEHRVFACSVARDRIGNEALDEPEQVNHGSVVLRFRRIAFVAAHGALTFAVRELNLVSVREACGYRGDMKRHPSLALALGACGLLACASPAQARDPSTAVPDRAILDAGYPEVDALYVELHRNPELSDGEEKTSATVAGRLRALGYEVTTGVGGHGFVGVMRNGSGPTVALRTELDGLPVLEKTGLPYASKVVVERSAGARVPVMHACGHDVHMASLVGAATYLVKTKARWRGTVVLIGQPGEESLTGAAAMIADGLFRRFPKPEALFSIHDAAELPAGKVGIIPGYAQASADFVDVTFYGRGGHGGQPHLAIDPIVIASRAVLAFQTIVSRENNPVDPAVLTVGSFHGGDRPNIIPDEVKLELTVRAIKPEVREHVIAAIERVAKAEAAAAAAPKEPTVIVRKTNPPTFNDPQLVARMRQALRGSLGDANVVELPAPMTSDDFALYGREGVPSFKLWFGAVDPQEFERAKAANTPLAGPHSPTWAPDRERTLRTGVASFVTAALAFLGRG
jgi:hippurate hydrolase